MEQAQAQVNTLYRIQEVAMQVVEAKTSKHIRAYRNFSARLYKGDSAYVCTSAFAAKALLYGQTNFAKSCEIVPLMVCHGKMICAVCTVIYNPELPFLQIGLFDAQEGVWEAVDLLIKKAKQIAKSKGLEKIVVGLNGHISYGVGILEDGFDKKISFDSVYNKSYYKDYFAPYASVKQTLSTYRAPIDLVLRKLPQAFTRENIRVRKANLRQYSQEMEIMRNLCDLTLGKTYLYGRTNSGHFSQLMQGLRPFLCDKNLLFSVKEGKETGFLFWHPDYNEMFNGGRKYNLLQIFYHALKAQKKALTLKINAIGVLDNNLFAAAALITALSKYAVGNYRFAETNFVWDNNTMSTQLNKNLFGEPERKYGVYFIDV